MTAPRGQPRVITVLWIAGLLAVAPAISGAQVVGRPLVVGDSLAPLEVARWLRGDPVDGWEQGDVYLIDLWATWCSPCLASMPHLAGLQERFAEKGLVVIGVTSEDRWGNDLAAVEEFLRTSGAGFAYRMAWLPPSRSEEKDLEGIFVHEWMQRLGTMSLPMAFLVDGQGRLVWVGNPHVVEPTIEALVSGNFDMMRARAEFEQARAASALRDQADAAIDSGDWDAALATGSELLTEYGSVADPKILTGFAGRVAAVDGDVPEALFELAVRAAERAVVATRFEAPGHLDGLAGVLAARGDMVGAVLAEMRAVAISDGEMKVKQEERLEQFLRALHDGSGTPE